MSRSVVVDRRTLPGPGRPDPSSEDRWWALRLTLPDVEVVRIREMYCLVYEYDVDAERRTEFERTYGATGEWAAIFRQAEGYLGTNLYREVGSDTGRYVLVDRWAGKDAFLDFKVKYSSEYERFAQQATSLYRHEWFLGGMSALPDTGIAT